ncbi:hypothetical protein B0J17DRAFT_772371 [Rhizoctonia solani]|nr:hypothetical protein B0J17DRAFT_772371 [Rhizoctonia solani]
MSMVLGLYQRRALGFKDHYVYGTAHHSGDQLTVFAGAWKDEAFQDGNMSKDAKITLYKLDTFDLTSTADMYKELLEAVNSLSIVQSLDNMKGLDSWPPKLDSRSRPGTSKSSRDAKRRRLSSDQEKHHDSASPPINAPSEPSHSISPNATNINHCDYAVAVDDPLKRRFVDVLSWNGEWVKVHGYLTSSLHEQYNYQVEEIHDEVGDSSGHGHNHPAQAVSQSL